ncbi:MAG: peptidoglycan-binding protein [Symploca sp. SIO2E6]|nr:peptidoglycan-binding protein [Symploca sp. SIO2E6]
MSTTITARSTLKQGSTGQDVKELQVILNSIGDNLVIDGIFGLKTLQAVIAFQKQHNLLVDGIVGPKTWNKLDFAIAPDFIILRRGSRGEAVTYLQQHLNHMGFGSLVVDGIFGPATEKSVKKLQAYYGLTVDGIVGSQTWVTIV